MKHTANAACWVGVVAALLGAGCAQKPTPHALGHGMDAGVAGSGLTATEAAGTNATAGAGAASTNTNAGRTGGSGATGRAAGSGAAGRAGGSAGKVAAGSGGSVAPAVPGFYHMERLNRGLVAVKTAMGVYLGWRLFGYEYDPAAARATSFNVYRDGMRIANVVDSTNYQDSAGTSDATYAVGLVVNDVEQASSESVKVAAQDYLRIPLSVPAGGTTSATCDNANEAYTYSANDASVGDIDGDGEYEIILKWDPSNAKDNSQSGCTGNVFIDAYTLAGKRLWRIDLGPNIRAGAHYTQFMVYDFDADGKAEMAVKTAPGTRDAANTPLHTGPAANDDDNASYRAKNGYVLSGPEYLTVFDGQTGAEKVSVNFDQARGTVSAWGDDYGNRVDRFLAAVAYLDDTGLPSVVMARGYYTRTTLTAWNYRDGKLSPLWKFDSNVTPRDKNNKPFTGQGSHSLSVANVDADRGQEIIYGAMTIDHDGKGKCSTGFGHGDALHVTDLVLDRPGLEVFMPHEDTSQPSYDIHDANTCEVIVAGPVTGEDTGRGVAADVAPGNAGGEMWAAGGTQLLRAGDGKGVGNTPASANFVIYWDADESRELENATSITKYGAGSLLTCAQCAANNGTKSTPALTADIYGDWREEVIWRETDSTALRIYTTTAVTQRRIYTLMHDPQYRVAVAWQNVAYNQPPHPSFHIGSGMAAPPKPDITVP